MCIAYNNNACIYKIQTNVAIIIEDTNIVLTAKRLQRLTPRSHGPIESDEISYTYEQDEHMCVTEAKRKVHQEATQLRARKRSEFWKITVITRRLVVFCFFRVRENVG